MELPSNNETPHFLVDGIHDQDLVDDYFRAWRIILDQKVVLVCVRADSNEIVGLNMTYVISKGDTCVKHFKGFVSNQSRSQTSEDFLNFFFFIGQKQNKPNYNENFRSSVQRP